MRTIQLKTTGFTPEQLASHARLVKAADEMGNGVRAYKAFGATNLAQIHQQIKDYSNRIAAVRRASAFSEIVDDIYARTHDVTQQPFDIRSYFEKEQLNKI